MKVLLIQPPVEDFYNTSIRTYPLQLLYLATKVKGICDVSVVDLKTNRKPKVIPESPFPELGAYYKAGVYTPLSLFTGYYRFGESSETIERLIRQGEPDLVAVSSLFTAYYAQAIEVAGIAKEVSKDIITVMGGTHPTVFPEATLDSPYVDYIIRGEGETPFFQLIDSLRAGECSSREGIPGLCFKSRDGSVHISDVHFEKDIDPAPDRTFLNRADYLIRKKPYTFFLTSRGCPFHCSFCGKPPVPYRKRSIGSIERELKECLSLGIQAIDFEDDMLTFDPVLFNKVLDFLEGKGLTLSAMNGIYAESLTESTLERMSAAGFRRLNFSLVDIHSSVAKDQKRHLPARFLQLLPFLEASSFLTETHFIIGLPGQKPEDVMETLIFLMDKRLLPGPSIFYLAPGSSLFGSAADGDAGGYMRFRSSYMAESNPLFPRPVTYTFMKLTRLINFVKGCLDREPSLNRLSDLSEFLKGSKEGIDKEILGTLLQEKRLIAYDVGKRLFVEEPQDKDLLKHFFRKAKGARIKGFKTSNSLIVDV